MATITETFTIKGDAEVTLRINIGEGQIGGYHVVFKSKNQDPVSQDAGHAFYRLGQGQQLRYEDLVGTVLVKDVSPKTDRTSITVTVAQGDKQSVFTQSAIATTGGTVAYGIAIFFE